MRQHKVAFLLISVCFFLGLARVSIAAPARHSPLLARTTGRINPLAFVPFPDSFPGLRPPVIQESLDHQLDLLQLYAEYDREFLQYLAGAVAAVGKETIRLEPLSDIYTVPKRLNIEGTPYEIGYTLGHMAFRSGQSLPMRGGNPSAIHSQIIGMYGRIYPQYLDMIKGVADAYGLPADQLDMIEMEFRFFLTLYFRLLQYERFYTLTDYGTYGEGQPTEGCSLASYYNGRQHIFGRNFDNSSDRPHYFASTQTAGCYRVMGNAVYDMYNWVADGINEKGLSISQASNGEEYFWQDGYPGEPAVFSSKMARIVMDTCATVDEAVGLIGSVRIWFPNQGLHWLIADSSGKSVIVEFDLNRRMVVFDRQGPFELVTNTALQKGENYVVEHCWRYRIAKPMLECGIQSNEAMLDVMKAVRQTTGGGRSLWTSIMDLKQLSYEVHYLKEYDRKYQFGFGSRSWFYQRPSSSRSTVP